MAIYGIRRKKTSWRPRKKKKLKLSPKLEAYKQKRKETFEREKKAHKRALILYKPNSDKDLKKDPALQHFLTKRVFRKGSSLYNSRFKKWIEFNGLKRVYNFIQRAKKKGGEIGNPIAYKEGVYPVDIKAVVVQPNSLFSKKTYHYGAFWNQAKNDYIKTIKVLPRKQILLERWARNALNRTGILVGEIFLLDVGREYPNKGERYKLHLDAYILESQCQFAKPSLSENEPSNAKINFNKAMLAEEAKGENHKLLIKHRKLAKKTHKVFNKNKFLVEIENAEIYYKELIFWKCRIQTALSHLVKELHGSHLIVTTRILNAHILHPIIERDDTVEILKGVVGGAMNITSLSYDYAQIIQITIISRRPHLLCHFLTNELDSYNSKINVIFGRVRRMSKELLELFPILEGFEVQYKGVIKANRRKATEIISIGEIHNTAENSGIVSYSSENFSHPRRGSIGIQVTISYFQKGEDVFNPVDPNTVKEPWLLSYYDRLQEVQYRNSNDSIYRRTLSVIKYLLKKSKKENIGSNEREFLADVKAKFLSSNLIKISPSARNNSVGNPYIETIPNITEIFREPVRVVDKVPNEKKACSLNNLNKLFKEDWQKLAKRIYSKKGEFKGEKASGLKKRAKMWSNLKGETFFLEKMFEKYFTELYELESLDEKASEKLTRIERTLILFEQEKRKKEALEKYYKTKKKTKLKKRNFSEEESFAKTLKESLDYLRKEEHIAVQNDLENNN